MRHSSLSTTGQYFFADESDLEQAVALVQGADAIAGGEVDAAAKGLSKVVLWQGDQDHPRRSQAHGLRDSLDHGSITTSRYLHADESELEAVAAVLPRVTDGEGWR